MDEQLSFIETQLPVSKVSKESYKERKANNGQTLTGLGKWWGRKPLFLIRAAILGCLMPSSNNPKRDMEIFQKILTIDDDGLNLRRTKKFTNKELFEYSTAHKKLKKYVGEWFEVDSKGKIAITEGVERDDIERTVFNTLSYDEKLKYCVRPEEVKIMDKSEWNEINHYLGTDAYSLDELVQQLSTKRYSHTVKVGDCFSGGGSIPFEVARIGANAYGSDLNPIASLLTWADVNILGADAKQLEAINDFRQKVYDEVNSNILKLGIETNEKGDRAICYLYCVEAVCPECGHRVPLSPSWVIGKGTKTVAILKDVENGFDIEVKTGVSAEEFKNASYGTVSDNKMICPHCGKSTPISSLRHDSIDSEGNIVYGLRRWERDEFEPRPEDIYHERLYAIKYEHTEIADGKIRKSRYYSAPGARDLLNEKKVHDIVAEKFTVWQQKDIVPVSSIEDGMETARLARERGWSYWHQLFNPRQLYLLTSLKSAILKYYDNNLNALAALLGFHKCVDWDSKICRWNSGAGNEKSEQTYYNQALNTMMNWGTRSLLGLETCWFYTINKCDIKGDLQVDLRDAREIDKFCDYWITDPPYADAVNYHELSELFLSWDKSILTKAFPDWYTDSKRILAVKGDEHFSQTMIDIYSNLAKHMPDNGMQIVMFTHSDPAVWAQLAIIMWRAGLRVTAAWNIATETDASGLKNGNYVKGTVLLVLRKQTGLDIAFLDEINADIREEVKRQIFSMQQLDDKEEPNFSDPDYVLAAYAASLKVLTFYKEIEDLDLDYELNKAISDPSNSKVVTIIENAKKIAYDCVIPTDFDNYFWRELTNAEKFYIKGLESEKHGNYQIGTYQEFARGFSIGGYSQLMASERANSARLKTPYEMGDRSLNDVLDFQDSLMRTVFEGIYVAIKNDMNPSKGLDFIKNDIPNYWDKREMIQQILSFLVDINDISNMQEHWADSAKMADALLTVVKHDSI